MNILEIYLLLTTITLITKYLLTISESFTILKIQRENRENKKIKKWIFLRNSFILPYFSAIDFIPGISQIILVIRLVNFVVKTKTDYINQAKMSQAISDTILENEDKI